MMRKVAIILLALTISMVSMAKGDKQESSYKKFYNEYKSYKDVLTFRVPAGFVGLFIDHDDVEVKNFVKKMDDISFFISTEHNNQIIYELNRSLPEKTYKTLMVINDGDTEVSFLGREGGDFINEIIMAVYEPNNLVVMCINGTFTKDDAKKIVKSINTENARNFRN